MANILLRHLGNMGDAIFFIPPILESLKQENPDHHITFVTSWGYKDKHGHWGSRNMSGQTLHLFMTNPNIDQLVHWHDTELSLEGALCQEDGQSFPTWNRDYYNDQKTSDHYDEVYELDIGISLNDNPIKRLYQLINRPRLDFTNYRLYLTDQDRAIAKKVVQKTDPHIILLEGLLGATMRNWDPTKSQLLAKRIQEKYGVTPAWFGSKFVPELNGQPLTLRQNIATMEHADVAIGVLSGPLHFAAAIGTPTITLYADQPIHRAAPAYFLNKYIDDPAKKHRTLLGPSPEPMELLKSEKRVPLLTPAEQKMQRFRSWTKPGHQPTKSSLAVITVDEVMTVLDDMLA